MKRDRSVGYRSTTFGILPMMIVTWAGLVRILDVGPFSGTAISQGGTVVCSTLRSMSNPSASRAESISPAVTRIPPSAYTHNFLQAHRLNGVDLKDAILTDRIPIFHNCLRYSRTSPNPTTSVQNVSQLRRLLSEDSKPSIDIDDYLRLERAWGEYQLARGNAALILFISIVGAIVGTFIAAFVHVIREERRLRRTGAR